MVGLQKKLRDNIQINILCSKFNYKRREFTNELKF